MASPFPETCRHCGLPIRHEATLTTPDGGQWEQWVANRGGFPRWASNDGSHLHEPEQKASA